MNDVDIAPFLLDIQNVNEVWWRACPRYNIFFIHSVTSKFSSEPPVFFWHGKKLPSLPCRSLSRKSLSVIIYSILERCEWIYHEMVNVFIFFISLCN